MPPTSGMKMWKTGLVKGSGILISMVYATIPHTTWVVFYHPPCKLQLHFSRVVFQLNSKKTKRACSLYVHNICFKEVQLNSQSFTNSSKLRFLYFQYISARSTEWDSMNHHHPRPEKLIIATPVKLRFYCSFWS